ncbi:MAG TPA: hypothetical protein VFF69_15390 [Phycisphaerales bacterium]|nr:hypothetical protein [Phycisphaerales bacterium]
MNIRTAARCSVGVFGITLVSAATVLGQGVGNGGGPGGGLPKKITCHANCNTDGVAQTITCGAGLVACCCPTGQPPVYSCTCSNAQAECPASNCDITY